MNENNKEVSSLVWIGSTKKDLMEFPSVIKQSVGFALHQAQLGYKHEDAKPLKGFKGAGTLEIVERYDGDTYRAIYTVRFLNAVYVLHVFQKKSKQGIKTPKQDVNLVKRRMQEAEQHYKDNTIGQGLAMSEANQMERSSGNVFADLNIPEPDLYLAKANLAHQICAIIRSRQLTQVQAAKIMGINQPKVSALVRGNLDGFSSDRLFKFLNLLGQDIEILIHPQVDPTQAASIKVNLKAAELINQD